MYYLLKAAIFAVAVAAHPTASNTKREVGFQDIPIRSDLQWTPCYGRFQCSNLKVPLDYQNKADGYTHVAWIRQEAADSSSTTDILYNPGGPGGSGIDYILAGAGDSMMELFGGQYNIVSFDPRGVNNSGINLTCFPDDPKTRDSAWADVSSFTRIEESYAQAVAMGKWCTAVSNETEIRYAGTSAVVQDMMYFTDLQAAKWGKKAGDALIWYYGVSYGTAIGQTLAQMYPDRIGRVILDANVDGEAQYKGLDTASIEDIDKGMRFFFDLCAEAGPKKCQFAGGSQNAADIERRFTTLLETLDRSPLTSIDPKMGRPSIISKSDVVSTLFGWLYSPGGYFPTMAEGLDYLEKGNATGWYIVVHDLDSTSARGPNDYTGWAKSEVLVLVNAIDAGDRYPIKSLDDYIRVSENINRTSAWFAEDYSSTVQVNAGMNIQPPESQIFPGTFLFYHHRLSPLYLQYHSDAFEHQLT